jgi:hypothetical protein
MPTIMEEEALGVGSLRKVDVCWGFSNDGRRRKRMVKCYF